jgi:perosamine synthetase
MKESTRIPLSKPALTETDIKAAAEVLGSGMLASGRAVEAFERQLATYIRTRYAVCVSSGTAALHLALLSLDIKTGDDVIVPAYGYPAGANVVELLGARPVFVDSEPDGFNINVSRIENRITSRTRAIMVVHNFGWPVEIGKIQALSAKYDIPVIEDAACALGSSITGVKCGKQGKLAIFSFHSRKILTTGEGGAVVTGDLELSERIRKLRNQGQDCSRGNEFEMPGLNYRMTEFQAALGVSQMKRIERTFKQRIAAADYYTKSLLNIDFINPCPPPPNRSLNWQTFFAFVSGCSRDEIVSHLDGHGIEAGNCSYSVPHTEFYSKKYDVTENCYPESLKACRNLISLPLYNGITRDEQDYVIESLRKFEHGRVNAFANRAVETASRGVYE